MKEAFDAQKKAHAEESSAIKTQFEQTVRHLKEQTDAIGTQAGDLANALKGQNKMQGIFGETILPDGRIAKYPLPERDASKLLVYRDGIVSERIFRNLADELPAGSLMVFNDTKVVPARLFFRRPTGAHIEIFCLEPDDPAEYNVNFAATERCRWKCVIGNAKRWKEDLLSYDVEEGSQHQYLSAFLG